MVQKKSDGTLVTDVDPQAEKIIRELIQGQFPGHGILGEELGQQNPDSDFQWVIDPVDGTKDYIHGIPNYGCIITLPHKGEPIVGVIDNPETNDRYYAVKEEGTFWNGQRLKLEDIEKGEIDQQIISLSYRSGHVRAGYAEQYDTFFKQYHNATTLPNCFAHGLVARGALGGMANFDLNLWDIVATKLMIQEAGGKIVIQKRENPKGYDYYDVIFGKFSVVDYLVEHFGIQNDDL